MKYLESLPENEKDTIKIKVGSSYLNLKFRDFHSAFKPMYDKLLLEIGVKFKEELKPFIYCSTSAMKKLDTGFYISRDNKSYSEFNKLNPKYKPISWRKFKDMFVILESKGYVENFSGYNRRKDDDRMSSCIVFNDPYINLFNKNLVASHAKLIKAKSAVVHTKVEIDGHLRTIDLKGVKGIRPLEKEVDVIEKWLNTHTFKFLTHEKYIDLQRVFSDRIGNAGRFYFGALQCIASDKRKLFLIDGCKVKEKDYSSNHLLMIGEMKGVILPEGFKPYEVDISDLIGCDNPKRVRSILKMCCMFLLNSGTPEATFKKFWKENMTIIDEAMEHKDYKKAESNIMYGVKGFKNTSAIIKRLEEHNSYAKDYFRVAGGTWQELQFLDSEILLETMRLMMAKDKPLLPYHDSSLAKEQDSEFLEECMQSAWKYVLGSNHNCVITTK